jgi:hypothetical protein
MLKDEFYNIKKETLIVHSELLSIDFSLSKKIEKIKTDFLEQLEKVKLLFMNQSESDSQNFKEIQADIKLLKNRKLITKEKLVSSDKSLTLCEKEIGIINNY